MRLKYNSNALFYKHEKKKKGKENASSIKHEIKNLFWKGIGFFLTYENSPAQSTFSIF